MVAGTRDHSLQALGFLEDVQVIMPVEVTPGRSLPSIQSWNVCDCQPEQLFIVVQTHTHTHRVAGGFVVNTSLSFGSK